jgi:hypothetical protein
MKITKLSLFSLLSVSLAKKSKTFKEDSDFSVAVVADRDERSGIAAQVWHDVKLNEKWSVGAGAGPYIAKNKFEKDSGIVIL